MDSNATHISEFDERSRSRVAVITISAMTDFQLNR